MIGLLFGFLHICGITARGISKVHEENKRRTFAIQNGHNSYMDRGGRMRHTENDQAFLITKNRCGDMIEIDPYSGRQLKNITREHQRAKMETMEPRMREAKERGEQFVVFDKNYNERPHYRHQIVMFGNNGERIGWGTSHISYPDRYIAGEIWQNVEDKQLYVKRTLRPYDYILDRDVLLQDVSCKGRHNCYYANIYICLKDGMIKSEFTEWVKQPVCNADSIKSVPDDEREMINKKIDYLNIMDAKGKFIHRNGPWMNYAH